MVIVMLPHHIQTTVQSNAVKKMTFFSIDQILGKTNEKMEKTDEAMSGTSTDLSDAEEIEYDAFANDEENPNEKKEANNKQTPSYTAIIAQAILSSEEKKLPLGCVYDYITKHFPDFLKKGQGWRNCVRHNLSLSECFVKAGRARNGRGNYWGIHPRYIKNFSKGDYRKRRASHRPRNIGYRAGYNDHYSHSYISPREYHLKPNYIMTNKPSFAMDNILSAENKNTIAKWKYDPWANSRCCLPPTLYPHIPKTYYPQHHTKERFIDTDLRYTEKISYISKIGCSCSRCPPLAAFTH